MTAYTAYTAYTVEIEAGAQQYDSFGEEDRVLWQAVAPAENVTENWTAEEVARITADNQNVLDPIDGTLWRINVWNGENADTSTDPAYVLDGQTWLDEQADVADRAEAGR